jgi:purine-nucleoside phosphorylase
MQTWGAHAVGMSTVPEAIVAVHSGIRVLGLSCITNLAAGILDEPLSSEEVIVAAGEASAKFVRLLSEIISRM